MRRSMIPWLVVGCAMALLDTLAAAESELDDTMTEAADPESLPSDLVPGARIVTEGRPLSISEAVALSIRNNLKVEVERFEPLIAEADSTGAWGLYDPTLGVNGFYDVQKSPNTFLANINTAETNRNRIEGGEVGVEQLLPYLGASLGLKFRSTETVTRSTIQQLDPQYDSSLFLTAKVPLLKGLIWNEPWTRVKRSELTAQAARENFRAALMDNVRTTVDSYWNLVAARDQVRVAQKSLETSRALLEQVKTQYEVGVVSKVEVVEAEAGVADREFDLIRDANRFRNVQDELIEIVLGRQLTAMTTLQFVPTEDPAAYRARNVDVEKSVQRAFQKRPELQLADREIEKGEIDLKFAKNQRLPQLDADLRFGYVGVAGDGNSSLPVTVPPAPPVTPPPDTPYDDSLDNYFAGQGNDNLRVQGTFSIPFPNTTARKRVVRSQLELRRFKTQKLRLEQSIILEVRGAARLLLSSEQGIDAAERRRLAAEEQLRAERIRLEHGESTPFEVLQRESDLVEAESQKINALRSYRSAEVGLERSQGTILDFHDVVVDEVWEPAP